MRNVRKKVEDGEGEQEGRFFGTSSHRVEMVVEMENLICVVCVRSQ